MIHPNTELKFVSDEIGYGVFATAPIVRGTIVYVKDSLEIELTQRQFNKLDDIHRQIAEKYSYIDHRGVRIISWDHAKYVNHRCDCNTISTGYGFEIALRDIRVGEEITDEYGLFNIPFVMPVHCGCPDCRKMLLPTDIDEYHARWDGWVQEALQHMTRVDQPLWDLLDAETQNELQQYLQDRQSYRSVATLKWQKPAKRRKIIEMLLDEDLVLATC